MRVFTFCAQILSGWLACEAMLLVSPVLEENVRRLMATAEDQSVSDFSSLQSEATSSSWGNIFSSSRNVV